MCDLNSLPGCFAFYGRPNEGNVCESCEVNIVCAKVRQEYIPRAQLELIYKKVRKIEALLEGVA